MAKKILISYDFTGLELLNTRFQNLAADPGSPTAGRYYYNTSDNTLRWHNGTSFVTGLTTAHVGTGGAAHADVIAAGASGFMTGAMATKLNGIATGATANSADATLLARANHTGTQLAATISDFNTAVRTNRLDQMAAPTADVSFGGFKATNMANGVSATDGATYGQLLQVQNGTDWKQSVRTLSTTNVAALSGLLTVDGITLVANDRVALVGQTTASENGIYIAGSGAWTRSLDADSNTEITPNCTFMVEEGTTNADTQWRLTTNGAIIVGTTNLSFAQIGAGTSYTNGTGINIAGSVISVDTAVVVRKFAQTIGDAAATSITVTHGLGTLDVQIQVVEVSSGMTVECDVTRGSTTQCTLGFAVAPALNAYRVLVQG
jgi:hypothetical protein